MIKMRLVKTISAGMIMSSLLFGCSATTEDYSPEEVIQQLLADSNKVVSYYGESITRFNDGTPESTVKEWVAAEGKRRIESSNPSYGTVVTVDDGEKIVAYDQKTNSAYVFDSTEEMSMKTPKEQADLLLNAIKDTHTITVVGEEKVLDREVYHIKAETTEKNSVYGNLELWVDKENWFVLKSISKSGEYEIFNEFTKIEFNPTSLDDSLFVAEIPDDAKIEDLNKSVDNVIVETLDEANSKFSSPFLYVKEKNRIQIQQMKVLKVQSETNSELSITYNKDQLPYFTLKIVKIDEKNKPFSGKGVNIRGLQGDKTNLDGFRSLNWNEDGMAYIVTLDNPALSFETVIELLQGMERVQ